MVGAVWEAFKTSSVAQKERKAGGILALRYGAAHMESKPIVAGENCRAQNLYAKVWPGLAHLLSLYTQTWDYFEVCNPRRRRYSIVINERRRDVTWGSQFRSSFRQRSIA